MTQFDKKNWCVNIEDEKDSPLLPKFKEWYRNHWHSKSVDFKWCYYGCWSGNIDSNPNTPFAPLYSLAQLRESMPEIWGDAVQIKVGDTVVTERFEGVAWQKDMFDLVGKSNKVTQITTFAHGIYYEVHDWYWPASAVRLVPDEQVQQWKPEVGEEVEFTHGTLWSKGNYVGRTLNGKYVVEITDTVHACLIFPKSDIRPFLTLSDKIQAITGNAEMTSQILKVVEGGRG